MRVSLVTLCTGSRDATNMWHAHPDNASAEAWADLRAELDWALEAAEKAGVSLAIEPEPGNVVADARLARRLLDEVADRRLGIILDAANLLPPEAMPRQAAIVAEATDLLGGDLLLVHAKDVDAQGRGGARWQGRGRPPRIRPADPIDGLRRCASRSRLCRTRCSCRRGVPVDPHRRWLPMSDETFRTADGCQLAFADEGEGLPGLLAARLGCRPGTADRGLSVARRRQAHHDGVPRARPIRIG